MITVIHLNLISAYSILGFHMCRAKPNLEKKSTSIYVSDHERRQVTMTVAK